MFLTQARQNPAAYPQFLQMLKACGKGGLAPGPKAPSYGDMP
jgi:hypothetical protein